MEYTVERFDARNWSEEVLDALFSEGFPAFITADPVAHAYIQRVREWFAAYNIILVDPHDQPLATGWAVPISWDGTVTDLPWGYSDTLRRAVEGRIARHPVNTLAICGGIVHPTWARRALASDLIRALRDLIPDSELPYVIAPVRPTIKQRYPLTPIDTFARWARSDGLPLDPWLRTHVRCGGRIIAMAPQSQTMIGTVEQWEAWTDMPFPSTGHYVIPHGLSPLYVDREHNLGTYTEPNVWVQHR